MCSQKFRTNKNEVNYKNICKTHELKFFIDECFISKLILQNEKYKLNSHLAVNISLLKNV